MRGMMARTCGAQRLSNVNVAAGAHRVSAEVIPAAEIAEGDAEAVSDGDERVTMANGITKAVRNAARHGHDERLHAVERVVDAELIGCGELGEGDVEFGCDGFQRVTGGDAMVAPGVALAFRNLRDALLKERGGSGGEMQIERHVGRRDEAEEAWIEGGDLADGRVDKIRDEAQIDGVIDGNRVGDDGRVECDVVEAVLPGVAGDDDGGEDFRHVIFGFSGQLMAFVELPEAGVAGARDGVLDVARAVVVGGHGQIPVAELVIEELHVAGVGARGFLGIEALIDIAVADESVFIAGHELPHAAGPAAMPGSGPDGPGLEAGLGDGEIDEVLGHAFFGEDAPDHGAITAGALKGVKEGVVSALGVGEEVDEGGDIVIHDQGKVRVGGGEIGFSAGDEVGIDLEGDVVGDVGRRGLDLGREAVTLLERLHLERVDLIDDAIEFVEELWIAFDVQAAGEHDIDGVVKLHFGLGKPSFAIVGVAGGVSGFNLGDEIVDLLLLRIDRRRRGRGLRGRRRGSGLNGRCGGLGKRCGRAGFLAGGRAAGQEEGQRGARKKTKNGLIHEHAKTSDPAEQPRGRARARWVQETSP